jgi:hypothetical protein
LIERYWAVGTYCSFFYGMEGKKDDEEGEEEDND